MQIVLRAATLYLFILILTRALGRKELSEISTFELLLLVVLGDLIQQGVTGEDRSVTGAMLAVATIGLLVLFFSYLGFRFKRVQTITEGTPILVVKDGRPLQEVLKIERLTVDEVKDAAREQGIGDLSQIRIGVLEADGKFSFVTADQSKPPPNQENAST